MSNLPNKRLEKILLAIITMHGFSLAPWPLIWLARAEFIFAAPARFPFWLADGERRPIWWRNCCFERGPHLQAMPFLRSSLSEFPPIPKNPIQAFVTLARKINCRHKKYILMKNQRFLSFWILSFLSEKLVAKYQPVKRLKSRFLFLSMNCFNSKWRLH